MDTKINSNPINPENQNIRTNPKYKDSVFSLLFSDPDILREVYYAIEGVKLPPDKEIIINTLKNVLSVGKLNDVSFIVDNRLVILLEHQSTINKNMPFRCLEYILQIYKRTLDCRKMLNESLVKIPRPEFIVLYNGEKPTLDYKELKLSDAFMEAKDLQTAEKQRFSLEAIVRVYNINHGKNPQMLEKSKTLGAYSYFVDKVREYEKNNDDLAEAIKNAVEYCIEHDVLVDFLTKHKAEVIEMLLELGTFENTLAVKCEMAYDEGRQEIEQFVLNLINQGLSTEEIKKQLERSDN